MKKDEQLLLITLESLGFTRYEFADSVATRLNIPSKRATYILCKWSDKGWWECGVSLRSGWLTKKGIEACYLEWDKRREAERANV